MSERARRAATGCAVALALSAACLLAGGWGGLEARLPGGLPVGNAVSAAALIFAAAAAFGVAAPGSWVRRFAAFALVVALSWLPVSIALAGNLELNFGEATGPAWLAFTAIAVIAAYGSLLTAAIAWRVSRARSRRP